MLFGLCDFMVAAHQPAYVRQAVLFMQLLQHPYGFSPIFLPHGVYLSELVPGTVLARAESSGD